MQHVIPSWIEALAYPSNLTGIRIGTTLMAEMTGEPGSVVARASWGMAAKRSAFYNGSNAPTESFLGFVADGVAGTSRLWARDEGGNGDSFDCPVSLFDGPAFCEVEILPQERKVRWYVNRERAAEHTYANVTVPTSDIDPGVLRHLAAAGTGALGGITLYRGPLFVWVK